MTRLTENEIKALEELHLVTGGDGRPSMNTLDLLDNGKAVPFLMTAAERLEAPDIKVAASLFLKRYAFLAVIYLYSMSAWNKRLDVSMENVELIDDTENPLWIPGFRLASLQALEPAPGERETWRMEAVEHLFKGHLFPVLDSFSRISKLSKLILWEDIAVYIFWLYDHLLPQLDDEQARERASEDFTYVIEDAPGRLFGGYNQNPLKRYHSSPVMLEELGKEVRVRKTCCFNYRLKAKNAFCGTCPRYCKQYMKEGMTNG